MNIHTLDMIKQIMTMILSVTSNESTKTFQTHSDVHFNLLSLTSSKINENESMQGDY